MSKIVLLLRVGLLMACPLLIAGVSTTSGPSNPDKAAPVSSVIVGSLKLVRLHDQSDYEQARALYVHSNSQPIVIDVERTLLGPSLHGTVIVFVDIDQAPQFSITWRGSYGILSTDEWKIGQRLVLRLDDQDEYGVRCDLWVPKPPAAKQPTAPKDDADDLPELGRSYTFDSELDAFSDKPGFCASLTSVFRLAPDTK